MKQKILLINPRHVRAYNTVFPPFGLMYLSASLKKEGYDVKVVDAMLCSNKEIKNIISSEKWLWIGFGVMTSPALLNALELSKFVKENCKCPVVWGGPHTTLLPEQVLSEENIDIAVIGEGEKIVVSLSKAIFNREPLKNVKGIGFKNKINQKSDIIINQSEDIIDFEKTDIDWDCLNFEDYVDKFENKRMIPLITSRGCPYGCTFCWNLKANKRRYREWSFERVKKEINFLAEKKVEFISFQDDNVSINLDRLKKIASHLKSKNISFAFDNGVRVDRISYELMRHLKKNGCHHTSVGSESGSKKVLDIFNKNITPQDILKASEEIAKNNLGAKYGWMIGAPGEKWKNVLETLDIIDQIVKINKNTAHFISIYQPYAGAPLTEKAIKLGWEMPKKVSEWGALREQQKLPWLKKMNQYKCVSMCAWLLFSADNPNRSFSKTSWYVKIGKLPFKALANFRWKKRFFSFPIDIYLIYSVKKILDFFSR